MSAFKGTPGPWEVEEDDFYENSYIRQKAATRRMRGIVVECRICENVDNADDARLIAAAPELLEACQTFAEWLRREDAGFPAETRFNTPDGEAKWREWFDENLRVCALAQEQARAAIDKATGGAA